MAKKSKDKGETAKDGIKNPYAQVLSTIDKKFALSTGDFSPLKLSTGVLAIDWICAGGLVPGMTTISGFEASGKSTLSMETLAEGLDRNIPFLRVDDAEGTFDGVYTSTVIRRPLDPLLPQYKKNKLINNPRIWYSTNNEIEVFYDSLVQTLNRMPDKIFNKEAKGWFFVVDKKNKHHDAFINSFKESKTDAVLSRGDKLYYPTDNISPQGIVFIDSYASMVTHRMVEKEEADGMPTGPAIAFAKNIPRVTGFLKKKAIIIFGVNQMRERPGMAFGNPQYEVGGNALKLFSNNRLLVSARTVPDEWKVPNAKTTQFREEPSLEFKGGVDQYAYKHIRNLKLKHGTPYKQCWARIWISDGRKLPLGRGYDKVFDTYEYLQQQGLAEIEKLAGRMYVKFNNLTLGKNNDSMSLSKKTITWLDFKALVLNEVLTTKTDYFKECLTSTLKSLKLKEPPKLRDFCYKHLAEQIK